MRRSRPRRWIWAMATVALLAATACSDNSDDPDGDPATSNGDSETSQEEEPSRTGESEVLEASNQDETFQLTVSSVAREGDLVVIEGTLTNTGNERVIPTGDFAELDYGTLEATQANDLSGFVVIDWEHSTAHYPARTNTGDCACTIIEDRYESAFDPGDSMEFFVAYKLDDPSSELTLVAPGFRPVDGLPATGP